MGAIISKIEDVERIVWAQPRKGRVYKATRILFVDETQCLIELENGTFTVAGRRHPANGKWAVAGYGLEKFTSAVLDGLVRLGVLTKDQVAAHKKDAREAIARRDRTWREKSIRENCAELGLSLPKELQE